MQSALSDYIHYLKQVVGVGAVLLPAVQEDPNTLAQMFHTRSGHWPPAGSLDLLVLIEGGQSRELWQGETEVLWDKMKFAMKLGSSKILEVESIGALGPEALHQLLLVFPATVLLVMKAAPARGAVGNKILQSSHVIETFPPSTLVANPEMKRESWTDLQGVMRILQVDQKN